MQSQGTNLNNCGVFTDDYLAHTWEGRERLPRIDTLPSNQSKNLIVDILSLSALGGGLVVAAVLSYQDPQAALTFLQNAMQNMAR